MISAKRAFIMAPDHPVGDAFTTQALAKAEGTILRLRMRTRRLQLYFKMYMT